MLDLILSERENEILTRVKENPQTRQELISEMHISPSTLQSITDRLFKYGLLTRRPRHHDKPGHPPYEYFLTIRGQRYLDGEFNDETNTS